MLWPPSKFHNVSGDQWWPVFLLNSDSGTISLSGGEGWGWNVVYFYRLDRKHIIKKFERFIRLKN